MNLMILILIAPIRIVVGILVGAGAVGWASARESWHEIVQEWRR